MEKSTSLSAKDTYEFLAGGGEMGERIRSFDWSETSLGRVESWPRSLRTCVQIMLTSRQPIWIGWGKDLIKLYNDPYKQIVKGKHPWALGKPASVVWSDIWHDIQPMLQKVMYENEGTYVEAQLLIMERNGYPEETYYTFSYTPVAGDHGRTEGMICFNTDDTDRIISERQLKTLTELGKALTGLRTEKEVFDGTINIIKDNPHDFPFALLYRISGRTATLEHATEFGDTFEKVPKLLNLENQDEVSQLCLKASVSHEPQVLDSLIAKIGTMPKGPWGIPPDKAIILPIQQHGSNDCYGFFVVGLNPYRILDNKYSGFFNLITDQISTSLNSVHAIEEERKRIEAFAEIDRAKTIFFSNISHEFRTPLTLLLGPLEDILNDKNVIGPNKEKASVAFRNAQRMQKLVNMLLDFSRIEAGKMEARFQPVDIVTFIEDICSTFRDAIEKAGMKLIVETEPISKPVMVDVDMWEKIMLNLLSNAFKYSLEGAITVGVKDSGDHVSVSVSDTGVGIPDTEIEKIFERFHRIQNDHGRSQEGTGIGLAMVKELVKLHDGTIRVESEVGKGSTFMITVPYRAQQHDNGIAIHRKNIASSVYVDEAVKWLPSESIFNTASNGSDSKKEKPKVLVADDNADMRLYMERIMSADFDLILAVDGDQAFEKAVALTPDLILSDIMMPKLDGFGLLGKLKNNIATKHIPLIFLSARAGEEAKIEGIRAGADDYMTKPFSSKELLARVANAIAISKARRSTEREFYNLFRQSPAHIHIIKGPDYVMEFFHPLAIDYIGQDMTGKKLKEIAPYLAEQGYFDILDRVFYNGETIRLNESKAVLKNADGGDRVTYFNLTYLPYRDVSGHIVGILQFSYDITEHVLAKQKLAESEERLRIAAELVELGTWEYDPATDEIYCSEKTIEFWGFDRTRKIRLSDTIESIVDEDRDQVTEAIGAAFDPNGTRRFLSEFTLINKINGQRKTLRNTGKVLFDENNKPTRFIGTALDVTEIKKAEQELKESERRFRTLANSIRQVVWITDAAGTLEYVSDQWEEFTGAPASTAVTDFMEFLHPEDAPMIVKNWENSVAKGVPWENEYRLRNIKTGTFRWFHGKTQPLRDESGKIVNWIGSASDIQHLKEQSSWLEQQIQDRTFALKELNQSLKLSNEDLQQFAHVASHDLKEPIRKIKTYTNRLREEFESILPDKGKVYLDKIKGASDRMHTMIDGVLAYSAYSALEQIAEPVNLNSTISEIELDLEVLIQEKKASIVAGKLPVINGAPVLIYQLFYNLINNSIKFSQTGVAPVINITGKILERDGQQFAEIVLSDNGIGFDPEHSDKIFTTFTRLNSKDKYEGTGLGLSLCKKIVQKHGGRISANSQPGAGATFTIILPK